MATRAPAGRAKQPRKTTGQPAGRSRKIDVPARQQDGRDLIVVLLEALAETEFADLEDRLSAIEDALASLTALAVHEATVLLRAGGRSGVTWIDGTFEDEDIGVPVLMLQVASARGDEAEGGIVQFVARVVDRRRMRVMWASPYPAPRQAHVTYQILRTDVAGRLADLWEAHEAATFLAGPVSGAAGAPSFRAIELTDLPAGLGTVTSVGLAMPAEFSVGGSPVVGAGTLAPAWVAQAANGCFAGPAVGAPAVPTFRALVEADIPTLSWSKVSKVGSSLADLATRLSTDLSDSANLARINAANSFTLINPLTMIAESWLGPSSTSGVYFKATKVGLGVTDPDAKLDVRSDAYDSIFWGKVDESIRGQASWTGSVCLLGAHSNSDLRITTNNVARIYVLDSGEVGVNISPDYQFHVGGATQDAIQILQGWSAINSLAQTKRGIVKLRGDNADCMVLIRTDSSAGNDPALAFSHGTDTPILTIMTTGNITINSTSYLYFGSDVSLYRYAANVLGTDDDFRVGSGILSIGADCAIYRSAANVLNSGDDWTIDTGLLNLGADVSISRNAANVCRIWDALIVDGAATFSTLGAFVAGDKYVVADATGVLHLSALGPAS